MVIGPLGRRDGPGAERLVFGTVRHMPHAGMGTKTGPSPRGYPDG